MASRLIRNQLPSNGLRVRPPCPPLFLAKRPSSIEQQRLHQIAAAKRFGVSQHFARSETGG